MPATVLWCKRMWEQLGGDFGDTGETFNVGHLVRLSEPSNMGPRLARAAIGYTRGDTFAASFPGEATGDTSGMRCQSVAATVRPTAPDLLDVVSRFGVPTAKSGGSGGILNPLTRPAVAEWVIDEEAEEPTQDVDKKKIVNAADEPFSPGVTRFLSKPVVRLRKNIALASFNVGWLFSICNKCNSDTYLGATAGQARIRGASATEAEENGVKFMQVGVEIAFRKDGWRKVSIRNRGRRTKSTWTNPATGKIVDYQPILGPDGQPIDEPVDLNLSGQVLVPADLSPGETAKYIDFNLYEEIAFGPLGLL